MDDLVGTAMAIPRAPGPLAPYLSRWGDQAEQRRWPLQGPVVTLGRAPEADIVVDGDLLVSRVHTTLELVAGVWTVMDNGLSRNGTYVNGRRVTGRVLLHDRDEIRVGASLLTFCAPAETTGAHTLVGEPLLTRARLTAAQRAVVVALCRPYKHGQPYVTPATNLQIAEELCLSVDAVKTHLRALFHRLDIDHLPQNAKRVRLAELALRYGLVSTHDL